MPTATVTDADIAQWITEHQDVYRGWLDYGEAYARLKAGGAARHDIEAQARAAKDAEHIAFITTVTVPLLPFLQQLYDMVLQHSEKRMPRWKVQLQPDILLELQPKITRAGRRFEFRAVQCKGISPGLLQEPSAHWPQPWMTLSGKLSEPAEPRYPHMHLKFTGTHWTREGWDIVAARQRLRELVTLAFQDGRFAECSVTRLFHPYCLACGKHLTDPVSMARFIGPECAGTSSPHIRRLIDLTTGRACDTPPAMVPTDN
jgi:hypothetical protein